MAYVPDVSGFMKPFGEADSLLEILERDVPRQLVLKYARDDISGFSPDMSISIKAEHGYRIRVSADGKTVCVLYVDNPSFKQYYNRNGCVVKRPVFKIEEQSELYRVYGRKKDEQYYFIQRHVCVKGNNRLVFLLRIWSQNTPVSLSPHGIEFHAL